MDSQNSIPLPAPTAWPMVLALGITLIIAGMVTSAAISILGALLGAFAAVGWFREVLPHEKHELVAIEFEEILLTSSRTSALHQALHHDHPSEHRQILPFETFSLTAGIKGGIAGGVAMTVPALLYGLIRYHSIWYAMNLLAAGGFVSWAGASNAFLGQFHLQGLLAALAIHSVTSVLVGLLFGAMLPMFPRLPILTAGFVAPFMWTGLLYTTLGIVSPILNQRIDWGWFIASQCAFGLVAGFVVNLSVKVRTPQFRALPFSVRAGLHTDQTDRMEGDPPTEGSE